MSLRELYQRYVESGSFPTQDFMELKKQDDFFSNLGGRRLALKSDFISGNFVILQLEIERPLHERKMAMFFASNGKVEPVEDMISFLEQFEECECSEDILEHETKSDKNWIALKKAAVEWLAQTISLLEGKYEVEQGKEVARLNQYYSDTYKELKSKRDSIYFHNYFFEKERQIQQEFEQLEQEISEHEFLLTGKYQLRWYCNCVLWGTVIK
jgi:hypothetical protein